jgi:hypothetical protein
VFDTFMDPTPKQTTFEAGAYQLSFAVSVGNWTPDPFKPPATGSMIVTFE